MIPSLLEVTSSVAFVVLMVSLSSRTSTTRAAVLGIATLGIVTAAISLVLGQHQQVLAFALATALSARLEKRRTLIFLGVLLLAMPLPELTTVHTRELGAWVVAFAALLCGVALIRRPQAA